MAFRSPPSFEAVQEVSVGNVVLGHAPRQNHFEAFVAATVEEMIDQAKAIEASNADIIEWRADYFADDTLVAGSCRRHESRRHQNPSYAALDC